MTNNLQTQIWTSIITMDLDLDTWGAWTQPILNMFTTHAGEAIFPCNSMCLAHHPLNFLNIYASPAQHDAGEFAGWLPG